MMMPFLLKQKRYSIKKSKYNSARCPCNSYPGPRWSTLHSNADILSFARADSARGCLKSPAFEEGIPLGRVTTVAARMCWCTLQHPWVR